MNTTMTTRMDEKQTVTEFEVIDHGIDGSQYFQGCGTGYTYAHVATGCGDTYTEALDDALESIAQQHELGGMEALIMADSKDFPTVSASEKYPGEDSEMYYYVSIRYNTSPALPAE